MKAKLTKLEEWLKIFEQVNSIDENYNISDFKNGDYSINTAFFVENYPELLDDLLWFVSLEDCYSIELGVCCSEDWEVEHNTPIFTQDRNYIEQHVYLNQ